MKRLLALEELLLFGLALYLFGLLPYAWWVFPALFFAPDITILSYAGGPKLGAAIYNAAHHRGLAVGLYLGGAFAESAVLQLAGIIMFGHASFDRIFGYGLKYPDAFWHTHLGWIGRGDDGINGGRSMRS